MTLSGISETYSFIRDFSFTPNFADINNDGYPDILVAGDFLVPVRYFVNQKDGTFLRILPIPT